MRLVGFVYEVEDSVRIISALPSLNEPRLVWFY